MLCCHSEKAGEFGGAGKRQGRQDLPAGESWPLAPGVAGKSYCKTWLIQRTSRFKLDAFKERNGS